MSKSTQKQVSRFKNKQSTAEIGADFWMVTCDNFVASLTKFVSSRSRDSSEGFLLGKLIGHRA